MRAVKAKHLRRLARVFGRPDKPERGLKAVEHKIVISGKDGKPKHITKLSAVNNVMSWRGIYRTLKKNPHLAVARQI